MLMGTFRPTSFWSTVISKAMLLLAFAFSERIGRIIRPTGMRAISKIVSLLLAAIAVNMIRQGLK